MPKISQLDEITYTSGSSHLYIIDYSSGSAESNKITKDNFLLRDGARIYSSGSITVTTGNDFPLTFDSERYDNNGIHSTSGSAFVCKTSGVYIIGGNIEFATSSVGVRQAWIVLNETTDLGRVIHTAISGTPVRLNIVTIYALTIGNYVSLYVWQNSGGDLKVNATPNRSPEFWIQLIG